MPPHRQVKDTATPPIPRARLMLEVTVMLVICLGYVAFHQALAFNGWFIVPMMALIIGYLIYEMAFGQRRPRDFGLRGDNLPAAIKLNALVFGPPMLASFIYAAAKGVPNPLHFLYALLLYPLWGLIQQFAFCGILLGNLKRLGAGWWSVPVMALAFCLVHYPSTFLMQLTGIGGLLIGAVYYRVANVWPVAIVHGVFGAFAYYVYRDKDPFSRLLDNL